MTSDRAIALRTLNRQGRRKRRAPAPSLIVLQPAPEHGSAKFTLLIPNWRPASKNELARAQLIHWGARARLKQRDADIIAGVCYVAGVTAAIGKRRVGLTITYPPKKHEHDKDAFWLSTLDGLKRCGALWNDSAKWCDYTVPVYLRGPLLQTVIALEDA